MEPKTDASVPSFGRIPVLRDIRAVLWLWRDGRERSDTTQMALACAAAMLGITALLGALILMVVIVLVLV